MGKVYLTSFLFVKILRFLTGHLTERSLSTLRASSAVETGATCQIPPSSVQPQHSPACAIGRENDESQKKGTIFVLVTLGAGRYATAYADNAVENFMASAVLTSLLHQDPQFYQLGHGGFMRRTGHAVSRVLITRSDSGKTQFNYSEVFGAGIAASISTYTYHPIPKANETLECGERVGHKAGTSRHT